MEVELCALLDGQGGGRVYSESAVDEVGFVVCPNCIRQDRFVSHFMHVLTEGRQYDLVVVAVVGESYDAVYIERRIFTAFWNIRLYEEEEAVSILDVDTAEFGAALSVEIDLKTVIFITKLA